MLNREGCVMSNSSIIKLTPTNTPNYQIHSSNKSITDQNIQLHQILASASAPSSRPLIKNQKFKLIISCTPWWKIRKVESTKSMTYFTPLCFFVLRAREGRCGFRGIQIGRQQYLATFQSTQNTRVGFEFKFFSGENWSRWAREFSSFDKQMPSFRNEIPGSSSQTKSLGPKSSIGLQRIPGKKVDRNAGRVDVGPTLWSGQGSQSIADSGAPECEGNGWVWQLYWGHYAAGGPGSRPCCAWS